MGNERNGHKDGIRAQATRKRCEAMRDVRRVEGAVFRNLERKVVPHNRGTDEHDSERRALRVDSQQCYTQASRRQLLAATTCAYCAFRTILQVLIAEMAEFMCRKIWMVHDKTTLLLLGQVAIVRRCVILAHVMFPPRTRK